MSIDFFLGGGGGILEIPLQAELKRKIVLHGLLVTVTNRLVRTTLTEGIKTLNGNIYLSG